MLVDLTPIVVSGVIDNTTRDSTELTLRFAKDSKELCLAIVGNCMGDIAGCRVSFERRKKITQANTLMAGLHRFVKGMRSYKGDYIMGDMTFSRREPSRSDSDSLVNMLSLEFFQSIETRVLIEGSEFACTDISLPSWECSGPSQSAQAMLNVVALADHIRLNVKKFRGPGLSLLDEQMPECRWDRVLNQAEAYMNIMPSIYSKYRPDPRGLESAAFVLDRMELLDNLAAENEENREYNIWNDWNDWGVTDFMEQDEADKLHRAMRTPLFHAVSRLIAFIREHITSQAERYMKDRAVEQLLAVFAGLISQTLATVMLLHERKRGTKQLILTRAKTISQRLHELSVKAHECLPKGVSSRFCTATNEILVQLRNIVH